MDLKSAPQRSMQGDHEVPKRFRLYFMGALGGILVVSLYVFVENSKKSWHQNVPIELVAQENLLESARQSVLTQQLHDVAGASERTLITDVVSSLEDLKSQLLSYDKPVNDAQEETARAAVSASFAGISCIATSCGCPEVSAYVTVRASSCSKTIVNVFSTYAYTSKSSRDSPAQC